MLQPTVAWTIVSGDDLLLVATSSHKQKTNETYCIVRPLRECDPVASDGTHSLVGNFLFFSTKCNDHRTHKEARKRRFGGTDVRASIALAISLED